MKCLLKAHPNVLFWHTPDVALVVLQSFFLLNVPHIMARSFAISLSCFCFVVRFVSVRSPSSGGVPAPGCAIRRPRCARRVAS